ncbi:hypothetical protein H7J71_25050 [Mycolicibacterium peregrinum]|uniref:hypothetical protein n=1 Tax=Mycolicibacterium peregrinum TaxID=43304 RepID=UPI0006D7A98F|nr:hypothetical protein [Mycolicibacterium peregrinum]MCV7205278.1 hypothetical protein [Mycolicibacterium peregrinum]ORW54822.1 hypothetical protein AWC21_24090 [Mycolicibacterium peregrinum]
MSGEMVEATGYLTVEGERSRYGAKHVTRAKLARLTQGKPAVLSADQVAVKVTIRIPAKAFDALQPEAVIIVPEELVQHPVEVEAVEP